MLERPEMAKWNRLLENVPEDFPKDQPVFMLNLLQFYDQAQYAEGSKHGPCSGQEAWVEGYLTEVRKLPGAGDDFELLYSGFPASKIVGEDNERWDAVALVKFRDIAAFRKTLGSDEYAATAAEHRDAALKDWKLIASTQVFDQI
ncbi:uncharacterized protein BDW43DRAFT_283605 [Aspergillus alliaceus]|uniref:uncharacterized protein n=1 Tax=Petromyces alliaceus TaxID=209559 RepID=UPI0012A6593D|nr:uncharacterized protein BDW43DRAFT_283605 [Aspergillus alliaceus]KAB8231098.1 hypothetical protein BDW43DRAFT_283605 [Aspergillus alliaceus]